MEKGVDWGLIKDKGFSACKQMVDVQMCKEEEENLDHLFLSCLTIWRFWALLTVYGLRT